MISGLHLVNADEDRIKRTIDCLVEHNSEHIARVAIDFSTASTLLAV
ncbi:MAG: hypothetical protein QXE10_04005 [Desulfurococcaceae archaeon]